MAPGSLFPIIKSRLHLASFRSTFLQSFTFRSINQKYQKYLLYRLSISIRSHFCKWPWREWQPLYRVGCKLLIVCAGIQWLVCCLLLDWYLGSQTEGNTYSTLLHHPFLFKEKTNASSRSSRKKFWHRYRGDLRQVKTYQVPIIYSHLLHYNVCHSPLVFLSPTSKTIFENICLFFAPLPFVFFVLFWFARLLDWFVATMSQSGEVIIENLEEKLESCSLEHETKTPPN